MRFYRIDDQIVMSKEALSVGTELIPNTFDGAKEKHVPVIARNGIEVMASVGSVKHPMMPEHHIEWILLETEFGCQLQYLEPGMDPAAEFAVYDRIKAAYEYCNLHGLWKKELGEDEQPETLTLRPHWQET